MSEEAKIWGIETKMQEEEFKRIICERVTDAPFYKHMGFSVIGLGPGEAHLKMKANPRVCDESGAVERGAIAALADAASGVSAATVFPKSSKRVVTVEQKVTFMAPVSGGELVAIGKVLFSDENIVVSEAVVRDREGKIAAKSLATFTVVSRK